MIQPRPTLRARAALAVILALPAAGCDLGPDYQRPAVTIPAAFKATLDSAQAAWPPADWWHGFGSAELDRLIDLARANNQNLAAASARVVQADAQAAIAGAPLLPTVSASGSGSYAREGSNTITTGGGKAQFFDSRKYAAQGAVSYELDFWGKNRATLDSAKAAAQFSRFDQDTVALTVLTSVAATYFSALGAADRLAVARHNLASARKTLDVFQVRLSVGTATALDVAQQKALLAGVEATIPAFESTRDQNVAALSTLVGIPPESITITANTLSNLPAPAVAGGLPSELLARRPDVAAAEANLLAQNGNVRAARAAFYPDITLTAQGGIESLALSSLLAPGSLLFNAAANATQTIFDGGLRQGDLDYAKGRFAELVADYRQATLQAFQDAETYLIAVRYAAQQEALERTAVSIAQQAADIAQAQLGAGTVDITTVLNTQNTLFTDQDALAQTRLAHFQALINLYKAFGGGWTLPASIGST